MLLDYESDAIAAQKAGDTIQYVIPKQTILIETPIAVTSKSKHASQAKAFVNWQWSAAGQKIWAQQGYRPVMPSVAKQFASKFPTPPQLFTIDYLGGWTKVKDEFFDPSTGRSPRSSRTRGFPLPPADAYAVAGQAAPPSAAAGRRSASGARRARAGALRCST